MKKGFTLIEILMATGIITAVILACFLIFTQSYSLIRFSEGDLVSLHLANQQMEFFRSGFARVPPPGGPYDQSHVPEGYNEVNLNPVVTTKNREYRTEVTVKEIPGSPPDKIVHVIVDVYRQNGTGGERKITLESYVSAYE